MGRETRAERFDIETRVSLLEEDLDELEEDSKERDIRVTRLLATAAGLLVSVCTAIIILFITGVVKP